MNEPTITQIEWNYNLEEAPFDDTLLGLYKYDEVPSWGRNDSIYFWDPIFRDHLGGRFRELCSGDYCDPPIAWAEIKF